MQALTFDDLIKKHMRKGNRHVPARLQAALALLERLRDKPSLVLQDHLASRGSSGLESHETYGKRVHDRLHLEKINKNHGRRSSSLQDWGQEVLDRLEHAGFPSASPAAQGQLLDLAQGTFAGVLRGILEQEPLEVRVKGRSAEVVVRELMKQAEEKGKAGDVAQYLVGAKLMLRLNRDVPVHQANKRDRKSLFDPNARLGDFEVEDAIIEVAVGLPDEAHVAKIAEALEDSEKEFWLLTRDDRVATWKNELDVYEDLDARRVVVTSVELFVGQNITELGEFSAKGKAAQLVSLFDLYNERWVANVGTPGIRIVVK
jgi:hypothetical protein